MNDVETIFLCHSVGCTCVVKEKVTSETLALDKAKSKPVTAITDTTIQFSSQWNRLGARSPDDTFEYDTTQETPHPCASVSHRQLLLQYS